MGQGETVRIAAVADLHVGIKTAGAWQPIFERMSAEADVALLCGDLTDYGLPEEADVLASEIEHRLTIPAVAVLGNHDYESGREKDVAKVLGDAGVAVLDGEAFEVHGIGFAGTKGFAGGFGTHALGPWGEPIIKQFVHEAIQEALKLETALARIRASTRIVLLHYTPVRSTAEGEPPEIVPYLGSSRLEEPISRYAVTAVFHGHAHHGQLEGETSRGVRVYNVSSSLLRSRSPDRPFRILEVDRQAGGTAPG